MLAAMRAYSHIVFFITRWAVDILLAVVIVAVAVVVAVAVGVAAVGGFGAV